MLASTQKSPAFTEVTMATQRFFGPGGGAARQDVLAVADVDEPLESDNHQEACAAHKKAKKYGAGQRKGDGMPKKSSARMKGGGQTLRGLNRRTGRRIRRYKSDSDCQLPPQCPWRDVPRSGSGSTARGGRMAHWPYYSAISMDTPVTVQNSRQSVSDGARRNCEQSL